jgi:general secretion pathway protein K
MGNRGVVIVVVLWVCAIIIWIALEVSADTRLRGTEEVRIWRKTQALYLAIGGVNEALARLGKESSLDFDSKSENGWQPDGPPQVVEYRTGTATVIVEDEKEKVNVNKAGAEQLKDVLEKTGMEEQRAESLAGVVADFIDEDDTPSLHGEEKDEYRSAGRASNLPFNAPLTSIDQMLAIPGVDPDLFYGYGGSGDADRADAMLPGEYSLFELLTVYGKNTELKDEDQDSIFDDKSDKEKKKQSSSNSKDDFGDVELKEHKSWTSGGIYRIISCGRSAVGPPSVVLCVIVRYSPELSHGYEVLFRKVL